MTEEQIEQRTKEIFFELDSLNEHAWVEGLARHFAKIYNRLEALEGKGGDDNAFELWFADQRMGDIRGMYSYEELKETWNAAWNASK